MSISNPISLNKFTNHRIQRLRLAPLLVKTIDHFLDKLCDLAPPEILLYLLVSGWVHSHRLICYFFHECSIRFVYVYASKGLWITNGPSVEGPHHYYHARKWGTLLCIAKLESPFYETYFCLAVNVVVEILCVCSCRD